MNRSRKRRSICTTEMDTTTNAVKVTKREKRRRRRRRMKRKWNWRCFKSVITMDVKFSTIDCVISRGDNRRRQFDKYFIDLLCLWSFKKKKKFSFYRVSAFSFRFKEKQSQSSRLFEERNHRLGGPRCISKYFESHIFVFCFGSNEYIRSLSQEGADSGVGEWG